MTRAAPVNKFRMVSHKSYFPTGERLLRDGRRDQPFGLELTTHRLHNFGRDRQVSGDLL